MIELERTSMMNFENALRGMRNPMNSWDKSDSVFAPALCIGPNDLGLARRLVGAGSDDRKFLRQIFVSVDVTAPLYWWKEYDTYKVGTVANSTSTMHKIHSKPFSRDDFSSDRMSCSAGMVLDYIIEYLEDRRRKFVETKNMRFWHDMIQLLPTSYNQMRTCTLNYENLINIYFARRYHKLDEWHVFCDWIEGLPYFEEICIDGMKRPEI